MKNNPLAVCLVCCVIFLYFGLLVPMPQPNGRPIDQLISSPSILANSAHSLPGNNTITSTLYLPIILRPPLELYGYVTENGQPAKDITVTLVTQFPHPYARGTVDTRTDENGLYNFAGVSSISCDTYPYCWSHNIEYYDPASPPDRLVQWDTEPITNYVQGTTYQFPTFDIGAPVLISPTQGDVVSPTVTFTWLAREFPEDNYGIEIFNHGNISASPMYIHNLGYTSVYTATLVGNNCEGPCSRFYNSPLIWRLLTYTGRTGGGYTRSTGVFTITTP